MRTWDYVAKRAANVTTAANTTNPWLFLRADDSTKNVQVIVPAGTKLFRLTAFGTATGGTTTNFTPKFFFGNATTTVLAAGTARAVDSATGKWLLEAIISLDLDNGKLDGVTSGFNGLTPTIETQAVITEVTCATQSALDGKILTVGGLFSAANAGNAAKLDFFGIEVLAEAK